MISVELKKYIEDKIKTQYEKNNYGGHGWEHISAVLSRCFELMDTFKLELDEDMVYTIAAFHDIGYKQDPDNHEQVSSEMFLADEFMKEYFDEEQRKIIAEAIVDHRASLEYEARSDYGKLVSSADREISVIKMVDRSIRFQAEKHKEENPTIDQVIEYSFKKLSSKYGKGGYAKMYFADDKYKDYLETMQSMFSDKQVFIDYEKDYIYGNIEILKKYFLNPELVEYVERNILPKYDSNDPGHGIDHILYVLGRSFKFAKLVPNINLDMVYVIAAYHDIGHSIDAKNHEVVSAEILGKDVVLREYFSEEEIKVMVEAVEDHRASMDGEPRSVYGKIVSSADRNTLIEVPLRRTYAYRVEHSPESTLEQIIEESREHLQKKFGREGYANEKMYFEDKEYYDFLEEIALLLEDRGLFRKRYIEVNNINEKIVKETGGDIMVDEKDMSSTLKVMFNTLRLNHPDKSLDELLYSTYDLYGTDDSFENFRKLIIDVVGIDEYEYYTREVNPNLISYIEENIFPEYEKNDKAHGIIHIREVIRRTFALNDTLKLKLDKNMIFAIAACHDWGKYIDHETHEKIAANNFMSDEGMKNFFTDEERATIAQAIADHRSSFEDEPASDFGKLISSADRNTRIEIVFIRSFFVAKTRTPEMNIEEYLDYTFKRLSKRYGEENPENMFFEDETYRVFLKDMRSLLSDEVAFKNKYCEVNHISSRDNRVCDEQGEVSYTMSLKRKES